jgi:hypothetical protein
MGLQVRVERKLTEGLAPLYLEIDFKVINMINLRIFVTITL